MKAGKVCVVIGMLAVSALVHGANPGDVVINEIAWMGTGASTADEWIELFNTTGSVIDLTSWKIEATDGTPTISLTGSISANGYYLLERTEDNTVTDIAADQIYSGDLGNSGEKLQLKDASSNVIDEVDCSSGWFAGSNTTKSSMERVNPAASGSNAGNWETNNGTVINGKDASNNAINGTPKAQNSVFDLSLSVEMSSFYATVEKNAVQIRWQTASEVDTRGFFVSRGTDKDGPFERLNTLAIPAKGNNAFGEAYSYTDYTVQSNTEYWYHLEELDAFGQIHSLDKLRVLTSEEGMLPENHELIGSFPNPFNPQTTIEYRIGKTGEEGLVDLSIFNLIGQKVKTLVVGQVTPGHRVQQWFGDDERGNPVSSGVYLLRLSVDGMLVASGKLIKME